MPLGKIPSSIHGIKTPKSVWFLPDFSAFSISNIYPTLQLCSPTSSASTTCSSTSVLSHSLCTFFVYASSLYLHASSLSFRYQLTYPLHQKADNIDRKLGFSFCEFLCSTLKLACLIFQSVLYDLLCYHLVMRKTEALIFIHNSYYLSGQP